MMQKKATAAPRGLAAAAVLLATGLLACALCAVAGCSPQEPAADAGNGAEEPAAEAVALQWSPDSDCAACHTAEAGSMSDSACAQASAHASLTCVQCHTETDVLATAHESVTTESIVASKATVVSVNPETCKNAACHGTMEDMAAQTEGKVFLTDSNGNQVNPHNHSSNPQHDAHQPTCTDCHKIHSKDAQKDAIKWCAQCHHRGVLTCGNCHEVRERAL